MLAQIQSTAPTSLSFSFSFSLSFRHARCSTTALAVSRRAHKKRDDETKEQEGGGGEDLMDILTRVAKKSGINARERRLLKVREAKRQRDYERTHNYPEWAKLQFDQAGYAIGFYGRKSIRSFLQFMLLRILEDGCKEDEELRAILGDSIGKPELMKERLQERVRKKGRDFRNKETGSVVAFKVSFRDFNPLGSHIWIEFYGEPSDRDVDLLGSVIQSWYVMGRLGSFNSSNLQLINESMYYNPLYDSDKASKAMPSSFHDISDVEFQDSWARVWVDLGTTDFFALDVLLNCLTVLSADYLGIKQVVFGGRRIGDWEEGMTNPQFGYKNFKI